MKILCAPDSFKGSLSSPEAAAAMARGIRRALPTATVVCLPLADGGEGTLEALLTATGGRRILVTVAGPLGEPVHAAFGLLGPNEETAVVEMASAAGLGLVPPEQRDPRRTSTYGVGQLMQAAVQAGARRLIVGLGGSATNDGGAGAMQALGIRFLDKAGHPLPPGLGGGDLRLIARVDASTLAFPRGAVPVTIASDVTNPLIGQQGASAVYGPQKGATPDIVAELDAALAHCAQILQRDIGQDIATQSGAGAAGGLGAALLAFLGAQMQSGIDLVLDVSGFNDHARDSDWVFTGEGRIDAQTLHGKTIAGVLARCAALGDIPVVAFGGSVDGAAADALAAQGLCAAFPIVSGPMPLEHALRDAAHLLEHAAERVTRLLRASPSLAEMP